MAVLQKKIKEGRQVAQRLSVEDAKRLERIAKGAANHWRLRILALLASEPGLTLDEMSKRLRGHFKTISAHTRTMAHAGLVKKRYVGRSVRHTLTSRGRNILIFLRKLE